MAMMGEYLHMWEWPKTFNKPRTDALFDKNYITAFLSLAMVHEELEDEHDGGALSAHLRVLLTHTDSVKFFQSFHLNNILTVL